MNECLTAFLVCSLFLYVSFFFLLNAIVQNNSSYTFFVCDVVAVVVAVINTKNLDHKFTALQ